MAGVKGRSGGKNRKPAGLKLVEGNPGKRKPNKREPKPKSITKAAPPSWLNASAKAIFRETLRDIAATGILTVVDVKALAVFSHAYAELQSNIKIVRRQGRYLKDDKGVLRRHPALITIKECYSMMNSVGCQFGWTPGSRAGLEVNNDSRGNDLAP